MRSGRIRQGRRLQGDVSTGIVELRKSDRQSLPARYSLVGERVEAGCRPTGIV